MFLEVSTYNFTGVDTKIRRYKTVKAAAKYVYNFLRQAGNYNYSKEFITLCFEKNSILVTPRYTFYL